MLILNTFLSAISALCAVTSCTPLTADGSKNINTAVGTRNHFQQPHAASSASVKLNNNYEFTGDTAEFSVNNNHCTNINEPIKHNVLSVSIDESTLEGCLFYPGEDCIGWNPVFPYARSHDWAGQEVEPSASFKCSLAKPKSSLVSDPPQSLAFFRPSMDNNILSAQQTTAPNGQPNGTVTLFNYPNFKGQYKKFRVFSNHCYLPPRKLRNAVKSLIISDKIDSCTFWSEPGCKGEPYWLPAGKIEDLKGEGRGFVSFQCLLVGESDGEGDDEAEGEGEELRKREGSTHY